MSIQEIYCEEIHANLRPLYANWHPGAVLSLGDFGEVQGGVFHRLGNIKTLGFAFEIVTDPTKDQLTFSSKGAADVKLSGSGTVNPGGPAANVAAALEIHFSSDRAVFFNAAECSYVSIRDLVSLEREVMAKLQSGSWERRWAVVTQLVEAGATTVVVSNASSSSIKLEAQGNVTEIDLAKASLEFRLAQSKDIGFSVVTKRGMSPLMGLSKVQRRWLVFGSRLKPMQSSLGAGADETAEQPDLPNTEGSIDELFFGQLRD